MIAPASCHCLLDETSVHEIVRVLSDATVEAGPSPWPWCVARTLTCQLLFDESVYIQPAPQARRTEGDYAALRAGLGPLAVDLSPRTGVRGAVSKARNWAASSTNLADAVNEVVQHPEYAAWLDWYVGTWPYHVSTYGGLFAGRFLAQIAPMMNWSLKEARAQHTQCGDVAEAHRLVTQVRRNADTNAEVVRAFVAALLVRGHYYQALGDANGFQVAHHPVRQSAFKVDVASEADVVTDLFKLYLANIVLASGLAPNHSVDRVNLFLEHVVAVRNARLAHKLRRPVEEAGPPAEAAALDAAVDAARKAGVVIPSRLIEHGVALALTAAATTLMIFTGLPVPVDAGVSIVVGRALEHVQMGRRVAEGRAVRQLTSLAEAGPGRVEYERRHTEPV